MNTLWLFGYGSLIWKPDFKFLQRQRATLQGWQRKFWQGSHDHRGTVSKPGRVVTLLPAPECECVGMAFEIEHSAAQEIFKKLDYREKNGYEKVTANISLLDKQIVEATTYLANEENVAFLGDNDIKSIAAQISQASGPSGSNTEYVLKLADALRELNADDKHVFAIEKELIALARQT